MKCGKRFGGAVCVLLLAVVVQGVHAEDSIKIDSLDKLQKIGEDEGYPLDAHYVLSSDIDASDLDNFEPIGDSTDPFTGVFDGNGHVITGLTINRPESDYVGLFGYVGVEGVVRNVTLEDCVVEGGRAVGGLAGRNRGTVLESDVAGEIMGDERVGGLVGWNEGDVSDSHHATGSVTGDEQVGGLVGWNEHRVISRSSARGSVTGEMRVGGLVGRNEAGSISQCYATGDVNGITAVGGLVGHNFSGPASESYATGSVAGETYVGGLIGVNAGGNAKVTNSYAAGMVEGTQSVGGLVGHNISNDSVTASFWDDTLGPSSSAGGEGKSEEEMQDKSTFTDAGWDFEAIWGIDDAYPYLLNNPPPMEEEVFGDVTGNGAVDANDVQAVITVVLGLNDEEDYEAADVNGDGRVDALDVQLVILAVLGLLE